MRAVCAPKCLEKDAHADFLCLHCYPNAVGDNTWAYFVFCFFTRVQKLGTVNSEKLILNKQAGSMIPEKAIEANLW